MGSKTLKLGWKPPEKAEVTMERANVALGVQQAAPPPIGHNNPPAELLPRQIHVDQIIPPAQSPVGPQRKHQKPERAKVKGQWFGVLRVPRDDAYHGRPIFRHPTRATAESEAEYLAELSPGTLFVVIEAVAWHQREKPARNEPIAAE